MLYKSFKLAPAPISAADEVIISCNPSAVASPAKPFATPLDTSFIIDGSVTTLLNLVFTKSFIWLFAPAKPPLLANADTIWELAPNANSAAA